MIVVHNNPIDFHPFPYNMYCIILFISDLSRVVYNSWNPTNYYYCFIYVVSDVVSHVC